MATLSISAGAVQSETGSSIGRGYRVTTTGGERTNRETNLVTNSETSFAFTPVAVPGLLVINVLGLANPELGDDTTAVHWGYATNDYPHELFVGESAVVRIRNQGTVNRIFWKAADVASQFNVEAQIWEF